MPEPTTVGVMPEWLDPWEFRYWLDDKESIGTKGSTSNCPIARYTREVTGGKSVSVTSSGVVVDGKRYTAPWVAGFIRRFDGSSYAVVTGRTAQEFMDAIK